MVDQPFSFLINQGYGMGSRRWGQRHFMGSRGTSKIFSVQMPVNGGARTAMCHAEYRFSTISTQLHRYIDAGARGGIDKSHTTAVAGVRSAALQIGRQRTIILIPGLVIPFHGRRQYKPGGMYHFRWKQARFSNPVLPGGARKSVV